VRSKRASRGGGRGSAAARGAGARFAFLAECGRLCFRRRVGAGGAAAGACTPWTAAAAAKPGDVGVDDAIYILSNYFISKILDISFLNYIYSLQSMLNSETWVDMLSYANK